MRTNIRLQMMEEEVSASQAVRTLDESDFADVVEFLSQDPIGGVHLHGMVVDNGLENAANRGTFYGHYSDGQLTGVALLGHSVLMCGNEAARAQFADLALSTGAKAHVLFGPSHEIAEVWERLEAGGRKSKVLREHHWCVCEKPNLPMRKLQMRRAGLEELDVVATAQAEMVTEECGVDPRTADPEGFKQRVAERIKKGRIWCFIEDGRVVFKADLISVSPEAVYLEGVWTHPEYRKQGIAKSCLNELAYRLLRQYKYVCLIVEPEDTVARHIYQSVGFVHTMNYSAHYLQPLG